VLAVAIRADRGEEVPLGDRPAVGAPLVDRGDLLVAPATRFGDVEFVHVGRALGGRQNAVGAVTVLAARRARVALRDESPVDRLFVLAVALQLRRPDLVVDTMASPAVNGGEMLLVRNLDDAPVAALAPVIAVHGPAVFAQIDLRSGARALRRIRIEMAVVATRPDLDRRGLGLGRARPRSEEKEHHEGLPPEAAERSAYDRISFFSGSPPRRPSRSGPSAPAPAVTPLTATSSGCSSTYIPTGILPVAHEGLPG